MLYATAAYGLSAIAAADDQKRAIVESEEPFEEPESAIVEPEEPERERDAALSKKETAFSDFELNRMYNVRSKLEKATRKKISKHIGVQEDDIIAMFVKAGGSMFILRHYLAVDKKKKAVVLAIRGTFSMTGILIDTQAAGGTLLLIRRKMWSGASVRRHK
jgi:hypothetical protein